ncbi:transposase [Parvularcula dongshanensis]|uniref:Transposase n=1 Tax=Parvularcula dongshanensis TaxID=1173995 RepID=A0A840HY62_9PROT|nr:transposase [Parvularcula dongshanensis]
MSTKERAEAEGIGTSRGGRTTKVHGVCDEQGRLRRFSLTGGNRHDVTEAKALLGQRGPDTVIADKGCDSRALRDTLEELGKAPVIPPRKGAKTPAAYDVKAYKDRNLIERAFGRLKDNRRVATRFQKRARNFEAVVSLCAMRTWLLI